MIGHPHKKLGTSQAQGLDLTALIDIIFIVLVFLLLTANSRLMTLPIDVPKAQSDEVAPLAAHTNLTITLLPKAPHWSLEGQAFDSWDEFETEFIKQIKLTPDAKVIVAADKNAPVQPLMTLLELLQRLNIENTQILMES
ncbi:biopolymer transporter ExbD [Shewanella sp. SR44-3]|uniref:ExbD/TolR family protein n=1 Tax=Shewanella sp. SR44-3 TaxID=2760936 RepID=UPI0015FA8D0B|nr:biopolymer transporter ExbD [Shewanella sp. SR44-3]MBB1269481.1 biopolymer transporter ExbD [Shewanella sp. SR44-3]